MFLTWIFWLSGAAAITAALGGGLNCGYVYGFFVVPLLLTNSQTRPHYVLRSAELFGSICVGGGVRIWRSAAQLLADLHYLLLNSVLTTFALVAIMLRGIAATRRGDGIRGGLVA
jgi:hypothetical protein